MEEEFHKIKRVIDANLNRTKEGLRVLEEISRFILDDKQTTQRIKQIRSDVGLKAKELDFVAFRESAGDVGRKLFSKGEAQRSTIKDIAMANAKRTEESLRVLEEFLKIIKPDMSKFFKDLRYETYEIEKILLEKIDEKQH